MRPLFLAATVLLAACAGPKPCTRTLCVSKLDGTMRLDGWNSSVTANATSPQPPVMNDSSVTILSGAAEFSNGKTRITAGEGAAFKFAVSTRAVPSLEVSSGTVVVFLTTGAPVALGPGSAFALPKP